MHWEWNNDSYKIRIVLMDMSTGTNNCFKRDESSNTTG